jgi:hypothetical protein
VSNYLDDLFSAKTPQVWYVWTSTDVNTSGMGQVHFSSGILNYVPAPMYHGRPRGVPRYVDTKVKNWGLLATTASPYMAPSSVDPSGDPVGWVDQLMIYPSGSAYVFMYGKRADFGVESTSFVPEIYTGSGFAGVPGAITGVLICRIWLGVECLVLARPDQFPTPGD